MQPSYINLLSLSPCAKEVPYLGTGIARADGQLNHGFKNLIAYPDLIDAIPELATDPLADDIVAQDLLKIPNIKHWSKTRLTLIEGNEAGVTGVQVKPKGQAESQLLPVEGAFIYQSGSKPITDFVGGQVAVNADGGIKVNELMATNVEGVWAIGDIRNTPFKQAVVAAGDGCIAAMSIDRFLNSRKSIKPDWDHT
jgi:thioredoxin reductase (NADPH)